MDIGSLSAFIIVVGIAAISAFFQLPILVWTVGIALSLLWITFTGHCHVLLLSCLWLIFLAAAIFANAHALRQRTITTRLLKKLQKHLPAISQTEQEALEAGHVWWEKELFCGRPNWKMLQSYPSVNLTQEEQDFLDNQVEKLCSMVNDWQIFSVDHDLPHEVWNYLKAERFFGMTIPKTYGGRGFSALAHSTIICKIATRSVSAAVNTMVPNSLGPAELLLHYGTEEQKNYYLPRLASSEEIPCFALTAPDAGSDASAIPDTGIICRGQWQGQEVIGIRLNWDKRYITLAPIATVIGLAFHLYDPEHLLSEQADRGITLCLIPAHHPGIEIGHRHIPLHLAFMNGPIRGKDVFIPLDWIIGGPEKIGQGWHMLMESLASGRAISLPALSTACGKLVYRFTGPYAKLRYQFKMPIAQFEGIEEGLGVIAGLTYQLEACRLMTASALAQDIKPTLVSAIAKYHMTEAARQIINHAMDIHAGHMVQVGPRNFLAHVYIGMPISITVEGANILTRNLIIFGQGAIRCHPYLLQEIKLMTSVDAMEKLPEIDNLLLAHLGYFLRNTVRSFCYGLTSGIARLQRKNLLKKYYSPLTRMSSVLAFLADMSFLLFGGSLKRRERISARLGDILSQLYLASSVLAYYHRQGQPASDRAYVNWCLQHSLYKMQEACLGVLDNLPSRTIGMLLRIFIFPFGLPFKPPHDETGKAIVAPMLATSELRERLTKYCYQSQDEKEIQHLLEKAFQAAPACEPLLKKIFKAIATKKLAVGQDIYASINSAIQAGILTAEEAATLREFEKTRREVIKVNEFSFDLKTVIS